MNYVFACGGTGGHIFPALSVAEELERRSPENHVSFVCGRRDVEGTIFRAVPREAVHAVESAPYGGGTSFVDPRFLLKLTRGIFQSRALLQKLRPALVAGFGGYVSFPVLMAARSLNLRTVIHEQNVVPGRANLFLARWAQAAALSHEESVPRFGRLKQVRVTGNPIRASIETDRRQEALRFFGFSPEKKTLLVLGGSQGAESVNRLFLSSLSFLNPAVKERLQVLHLCGRMSPPDSEKTCREASLSAKAVSFFDRMDLAYGAADFCLGRAGATFLAEIGVKDIPAILVPYPHGDGHQRENARLFGQKSRALIAEQADLTAEKLARLVEQLFRETEKTGPSKRPAGGAPNARVALADFLEECACLPAGRRVA